MSSSEKSLKDKSAAITGGAAGIGLEIADNFLRKGARKVALLDINPKVGAESASNLNSKYGAGKAVFFKCDVTNENDMAEVFDKLVQEFKNVDILVNNAGIINDKDLKKCIDVNLSSLIRWSLKFWEHMRKDKSGNGGTIINISSHFGFRVNPYLPVYGATKFAVYGFTKCLGHQYHYNRTGVRIVALCPGLTMTNIMSPDYGITLIDETIRDDMNKVDAMAVSQNADDVGRAAVELFENTESGTAWLIEGGKPISEV